MEENFLKKISILIVDDNETDLDIISKSLSRYFKKVHTASNGADAFEIYKDNKSIDIIISDIQMPKINGLELLKLVRNSDYYIPFLIVSATFDHEILIKAINLNVSSFLRKPIKLPSLIQKIDVLCERKYFKYKEELRKNEIENYVDSVNSVALIYKMNADGNITYMNNTMLEISGYKQSDIDNLTFDDIIHPNVPKKYIEENWENLKNGKVWKGNTKFIRKDKREFYLNSTNFKSSNEENTFISIAFVTTKENLEKRDFHKKVINSIKDFNIKESNYKEEIEKLRQEKSNLIFLSNTTAVLEEKLAKARSQINKYEAELNEKDEKYEKMLKSKKEEIEIVIEKTQKEMIKTSTVNDGNTLLEKSIKLIAKQNKVLKRENTKYLKRIKDLEEVLELEGVFKILCQFGKIKNTKGHKDEDRNRCRTICQRY
jgi:PAS domain S-box-containing protein